MKKLSKEEIEQHGFKTLRGTKLFNDKCLDCYVLGYSAAQDALFNSFIKPEQIIEVAKQHCADAIQWIDDCAGYSGRPYTDGEVARRNALIALNRFLTVAETSEDFKKYLSQKEKNE